MSLTSVLEELEWDNLANQWLEGTRAYSEVDEPFRTIYFTVQERIMQPSCQWS